MKKREGNGLRWGLICFTGIIFAMMVMVLPAIAANDCGEELLNIPSDHPFTGFFGDNSAAPYTESDIYDVVTDSKGKMWESIGSTQMMDWDAACYRCNNLTLAGMSDWRLPTVKELETIVNERMSPTTIDAEFTAQAGPYWTKSVPSNYDTNAFMVSFTDGQSAIQDKTTPLYIRCVRDGSSQANELKIKWDIKHIAAATTNLMSDTPATIVAADGTVPSLPLISRGTAVGHKIEFAVTSILDSNNTALDDITEETKVDYFWTIKGTSIYNNNKLLTPNEQIASILNDTSGDKISAGTYTVTLKIWDHSTPRKYGERSVTFTICDGDCSMNAATGKGEQCEYQKGAGYINQDLTLTLKSLFYQDSEDEPKIKLPLSDLKFKLVPDTTGGNRILFALQFTDNSNPLDKDGDGYTTDGSGSYPGLIDCNDNNPLINPGATEDPGNGINEDCILTIFD
ncbi:MAG: DUF1566 domain-containing protein [Desulfamplus sp.]